MLNLPNVLIENKMWSSSEILAPYYFCHLLSSRALCSLFLAFLSVQLSSCLLLPFPLIYSLSRGSSLVQPQWLIIMSYSYTTTAVSRQQAQQDAATSALTKEQICHVLINWAVWLQWRSNSLSPEKPPFLTSVESPTTH